MAEINRFGTTSDMIIQEVVENGETLLMAIDAKGLYLTTQDRVGNGLADANRYGCDRFVIADRLENLGFSPVELFEEHKDKIQTVGLDANKKKLNPLKASKRGLS